MTFWYRLCWWLCRIGLFFWHPVLHVHGRELVPAGCALLCALVERGCGVSFGYDVIARRYPGIGWFLLDGIDIAHDFCYVFLKGGGAQSAVEMFDSFRGGTGE